MQNCNQHPNEKVLFFCFDCRKQICGECTMSREHNNHNIKHFNDAIPIIRDIVQENLIEKDLKVSQYEEKLKAISKVKEDYLEKLSSTKENIQILINDIIKDIQERKTIIIEKIDSTMQELITLFDNQMKNHYKKNEEAKSYIKDASSSIQFNDKVI